uniref:Uncharacterized protein n=1 Tax=Oryza meridionalis TaxID=40149 RepID=A0A0E0DUB3_9ORYZ
MVHDDHSAGQATTTEGRARRERQRGAGTQLRAQRTTGTVRGWGGEWWTATPNPIAPASSAHTRFT